eukprot:4483275-Amphidinium_carterae.1
MLHTQQDTWFRQATSETTLCWVSITTLCKLSQVCEQSIYSRLQERLTDCQKRSANADIGIDPRQT